MPPSRAGLQRTKVPTPLAEKRVERGTTQRELCTAAGVSGATYFALDWGTVENPTLRPLVNCARALRVDVCDLLAAQWLE